MDLQHKFRGPHAVGMVVLCTRGHICELCMYYTHFTVT